MKRRKSKTKVNNSSRNQKRNRLDLDLVDRISTLPDSILGYILSFLSTKEAVASAFLSKRWKFVWRNVYNLDFCLEDCVHEYEYEYENMKFIRFVNRVFLLHDGGFLNKFCLNWNPEYISLSHVNSWVNTAFTRNIHELYLCNAAPDCQFNLPTSIFSCESLRSLELTGIYVPVVDVLYFPRLESLKLVYSSFQSEEDFEKLISGCPALNYLHIDMKSHYDGLVDVRFSDAFTYVISSTSLKRLVMSFEHEEPGDENCNHSLKLKASSLEYLKIVGFISRIYVQKHLSSLIEVDFRIEFEDAFPPEEISNSTVAAVDVFDCIKVLTLSADAIWALNCAKTSLSTKFKKLKKIVITTHCCYQRSLLDLIQNTDNLEVLTVYQGENHLDIDIHVAHLTWMSPLEVPRCLSNNLKKIKFHFDNEFYYDGVREMIRYMLKNGSALEIIQIFCNAYNLDGEKQMLAQEICKFSRKSPVCKIEFMERNSLSACPWTITKSM